MARHEKKPPVTAAIRVLRGRGVAYVAHSYLYEEHGGTRQAASFLGLDEHRCIKTLVMERDNGCPLVVLMHGDREVGLGRLAKAIGAKQVRPVTPERATRITGYRPGGISPFGMRTAVGVYVEATILALPRIYINGGRRGLLVEIDPAVVCELLSPVALEVAVMRAP